MKNISHFTCILTLVLFLIANLCQAQDNTSSKVFHIETKDGNGYTGTIVASDSTRVIFKADKLGELTILRKEIKTMEPVNMAQLKEGKYWYENPQATRYFFSPNGYGLKKGEGYYQNVWVMVNSFAVGVTNNFSLGGGMIPTFLFGGPTPVWITAKVSIPVVKDKFNLGGGLLGGTALGESGTGFGIFYGLATLGTRDSNISFGTGYGIAGDSESGSLMFNLNGMLRVGPKGYLLTENYLFGNGSSKSLIILMGGRTIIKGAGLDYGLMLPVIEGSLDVVLPWLGLTIPVGRRY